MSGSRPAKLALVTGGCRRVGAAISAHLAEQGYALALHGHSDAEPDEALAAVLKRQGMEWHGFLADLTEEEAPATLMQQVAAHFGRSPDLLVNNASLFGDDRIDTLDAASLERHWRIHLTAPTLLTQALYKHTGEDDRASVVNIVDQRVRNPHADQLSYTLSKQALAESIRTLAKACAPRLRINGVAPGMTLETEDYAEGQMESIAAVMPLQRNSNPQDIAAAVAYFAASEAVTGQLLYVDGGAHMVPYDRDFLHLAK
ncbi:SDR family oxidoreductase [Alterisphingorhabdus coralli]|uniref:SDR family oxidoreductase n=1 Tax=Alterisphingorhabdus coralli TaxID=3071408 RepID=A0AA97F7Z1_9SPHN|nr:SDR family oxidoreductase [Parasphingorhabdus sp. SCSIO 66989]WOE76014.1 SDR family oxidoreductase [Parasphingorhabdus sp. SCSIO 66989]